MKHRDRINAISVAFIALIMETFVYWLNALDRLDFSLKIKKIPGYTFIVNCTRNALYTTFLYRAMYSKIGWLDCFCTWAELESVEIFVSEMIESIRKYGTPNIHTQGLYRNLKCSKKQWHQRKAKLQLISYTCEPML